MSMATVIRALAPSEESFTFSTGLYVGYGVETVGDLDTAALGRAVELVSERYPVLRARLDGDARGHMLVEGDAPTVIVHEADNSDSDVLDGLTLTQSEAVVAVYVQCYPHRRQVVSVVAHHGIADARHALALLEEIWSTYTDLITGTTPARRDPRALPEPVEQFLRSRGIDPAPDDEPRQTPTTTAVAAPDPGQGPPSATIPMRRVQLSSEQTEALVRRGRRYDLTINEQISAAFVRAAAATHQVPASQVGYVYMVDLRERVQPAAGYTDITNALGFAHFRTRTLDPASIDLAAEIGAAFRRDMDTGVIARTPFHAQRVFDGLGPVPVLLTNWGRVPHLRTPKSLTVTGFEPRFHVRYSPADMASPPHASFAMFDLLQRLQAGVIFWFDDRLAIDLLATSPTIEPLATYLSALLDQTLH